MRAHMIAEHHHIVGRQPGCPILSCANIGGKLLPALQHSHNRSRHAGKDHHITAEDCQKELARIGYTLKPLDIVLIRTGASRYNTELRYLTDHSGMTGESTNWLIDQGIKMVGIDAPTWDRPVKSMFETKEFWPGHIVMLNREYYHLENMTNLDAIPVPHGFKVSVFPIKWKGTTAAPVRAVAIVE